MNQPFKRPLVLHYIAIALAPGMTLEASGLMDLLSDHRGDSEGAGKIVEWAHAPQPTTGKIEGILVDGETQAMLELFESSYVSPVLQEAEDEAAYHAARERELVGLLRMAQEETPVDHSEVAALTNELAALRGSRP